MNTWARKLTVAVASLLVLSALGGAAVFAVGEVPLVSPALNNIAADLNLVKTGLCGEEIRFSEKDFERLLGVDGIDSIIVRSLPSASAGTLMLGSLTVMKNQTISASSLSLLRFVPATDRVSEASFIISMGEDISYDVTCTVHTIDQVNYAPTSAGIAKDDFTVETYRNIAIYGSMPIRDPEEDAVTFEVVSYPKKGVLLMTDKEKGDFIYTPVKNYSGSDSFSYVVTDRYGNRSEELTLSIKVKRSEEGMVFRDLIGEEAHYSAIRLHDEGIMTSYEEAGEGIFAPEVTVSRAEFLTLAMQAAGIYAETGDDVATVFRDDEEIPSEYKSYVAMAYEMGYISGYEENGLPMFDPNGTLTRAEAALIVSNLLDPEVPQNEPVIADREELPTWAEDAVDSLTALGVLPMAGQETFVSEAEMDRGTTAMLLSAILDHQDK